MRRRVAGTEIYKLHSGRYTQTGQARPRQGKATHSTQHHGSQHNSPVVQAGMDGVVLDDAKLVELLALRDEPLLVRHGQRLCVCEMAGGEEAAIYPNAGRGQQPKECGVWASAGRELEGVFFGDAMLEIIFITSADLVRSSCVSVQINRPRDIWVTNVEESKGI